MAYKTPRYSQKVSLLRDGYDRELVLDLMERQAQYVKYSLRTNTFMWQLCIVIDCIMGRTNDNDAHRELMWDQPLRFGRGSNLGTFLANNYPRDHRIFNYVQISGYSDGPTQ